MPGAEIRVGMKGGWAGIRYHMEKRDAEEGRAGIW